MGRQLAARTAIAVAIGTLAACGSAKGVGTVAAIPSAAPLPSAVPRPSATLASLDDGPIRRLPPLHARVVAKATTTRLAFHASSGATVAPDGETLFIDGEKNGTPGGFIVSKAHPQGVFFGTSEVHDARFSEDGRLLMVYNDELDVATVLSVPDGAVLQDVRRAKVARFDSNRTLLTWDGCQLTRLDVQSGATALVGAKICGGADASDDGRTWMVVEPEPHGRPLSRRDYHKLTWIDASNGTARQLFSAQQQQRGIGELRLAPRGDYVCFDAPRLRCLQIGREHAQAALVPDVEAFRLTWDETGPRFVAASFRFDDIEVVDFAARTVRQIQIDGDIRYVGLLPGGKRMYAYDKGAWVIDLATGNTVEVFPKTVEVGGFVPIPHRDDRFMMGNEVGASRGYFGVELPAF